MGEPIAGCDEVVAPRQVMGEVFVGKTAAQVDGCTASALIYER